MKTVVKTKLELDEDFDVKLREQIRALPHNTHNANYNIFREVLIERIRQLCHHAFKLGVDSNE